MIQNKKEKFDFEAFVEHAGKQLRLGKPLTGSEGIFTPLLKKILEALLEGELDSHLQLQNTRSKIKPEETENQSKFEPTDYGQPTILSSTGSDSAVALPTNN